MSPALSRYRRWINCIAIVMALTAIFVAPKFWSAPQPKNLPFGCIAIPGSNAIGLQDFSVHMNYLRQIVHGHLAHPYRLADQEQTVHAWSPVLHNGFAHAYSPVTLVLAWPLALMQPDSAYFTWTLANAAMLLGLTWLYLFPRLTNATQAFSLIALYYSYTLLDLFNMGQTALFTTCLWAATYLLLQRRALETAPSLATDFLLAAAIYALAFKPSIALIGFALVLGQRAWRPFALTCLALLLTWLFLGPLYGGYLAGLQDYSHLLAHYCEAELTPFFHGSTSPAGGTNFTSFLTELHPAWNSAAFHLSQILFEAALALWIILAWLKRITLSAAFQGLLWTFLLLCPYLLLTEDFALCLLVVEGNFFRNGLGGLVKVVFILVIANLWIGALLHFPLSFLLKCVLAAWWLIDQRHILLSPLTRNQAPSLDI